MVSCRQEKDITFNQHILKTPIKISSQNFIMC